MTSRGAFPTALGQCGSCCSMPPQCPVSGTQSSRWGLGQGSPAGPSFPGSPVVHVTGECSSSVRRSCCRRRSQAAGNPHPHSPAGSAGRCLCQCGPIHINCGSWSDQDQIYRDWGKSNRMRDFMMSETDCTSQAEVWGCKFSGNYSKDACLRRALDEEP